MNIKLMRCIFFLTVIILTSLILFIQWTHNIGAHQSIAYEKFSASPRIISFDEIFINKRNVFNISDKQDLLVLLHIQKTGGTTFEKHLVQDLQIDQSCYCSDERRRCSCNRYPVLDKIGENPILEIENTWLLSRFSTGWICGLHADWTQLKNCFDAKSDMYLYFMTFLRDPVHRFISEFRHVQRGATWKNSHKHCENYDTQYCYRPKSNWSDVSLEEFMNCPYNMAINRQTRMLANHNLIKCNSNNSDNNHLLISAKENLKNMAFFGLCDEQIKSQYLFEKTFSLKFRTQFKQSGDSKAKFLIDKLPEYTRKRIAKLNSYDVELYNFAKELFYDRIKQLSKE